MQTKPMSLEDSSGAPIADTQALLWGNNAAWVCVNCQRLLGNRTGDEECEVECHCGVRYEILRAPNRNGSLNLGPATGVRRR
jgi:hypothetical protein